MVKNGWFASDILLVNTIDVSEQESIFSAETFGLTLALLLLG